MIYKDNITLATWEQQFPGLKAHPSRCCNCDTEWDNGTFRPWLGLLYAGVQRVCTNCGNQQDVATPINEEHTNKLAQSIKILGEENEDSKFVRW